MNKFKRRLLYETGKSCRGVQLWEAITLWNGGCRHLLQNGLYQEAKVRYLVFSVKSTARKSRFPVIVNYRSIDRWKLVENQKGKMVLFYRECRMPLPIPVIYVVRYDPKKVYFLKNISNNFSTLEKFKKFYEDTTYFDLNS